MPKSAWQKFCRQAHKLKAWRKRRKDGGLQNAGTCDKT
jgi:hypothetical protein